MRSLEEGKVEGKWKRILKYEDKLTFSIDESPGVADSLAHSRDISPF